MDVQVEFDDYISDVFTCNSGMGTNMPYMAVIRLIGSLSISGQAFLELIQVNGEKFGAPKVIGTKERELVYMIHFMANLTAPTGGRLRVAP